MRFSAGISIAGQQVIPYQCAFPLESVQQVPGLLIQEPQAVIIRDFHGLSVLCPIEPDGKRGHRTGDKADAAADGRDAQHCGYRDLAAAQSGPKCCVQLLSIQDLLLRSSLKKPIQNTDS